METCLPTDGQRLAILQIKPQTGGDYKRGTVLTIFRAIQRLLNDKISQDELVSGEHTVSFYNFENDRDCHQLRLNLNKHLERYLCGTVAF